MTHDATNPEQNDEPASNREPSEAPTSGNCVRKSVTVPATREDAFSMFTARMGEWWPKMHSIGSSPMVDVVVRPERGGRWFERGQDGSECQWGKVLAWEPSERVVLAWQIDGEWRFQPTLITEVEIVFIEVVAGQTRIDVEHRNFERFGPAHETIRAAFDSAGGWTGILEQFRAALER
jgi:uncharacterized protein YndB with AHSA1/START domain